jgi:hypothetical protein
MPSKLDVAGSSPVSRSTAIGKAVAGADIPQLKRQTVAGASAGASWQRDAVNRRNRSKPIHRRGR